MGYRSNVKSIIAFCSVEDRDEFLGRHPSKTKLVTDPDGLGARIVDAPNPAIVLEFAWVKWYGRDIRRLFPDMGYDDVIAWEDLMEAAEKDNEGGEMPTSGIFVRIGEELEDMTIERWTALDGDGDELMEPDVSGEISVSVISDWMDRKWEAPSK